MYYPWLDVPVLTAPMLIAIIALLHVFVSYYAVGGGLLLALENDRSHRDGDVEYRAYLKKHTRFFVTLTLTYGAVTGVGIWFFIGLASPLATEVLIKTFVFGWAIEWCFFLLEIVSGLAFYFLGQVFASCEFLCRVDLCFFCLDIACSHYWNNVVHAQFVRTSCRLGIDGQFLARLSKCPACSANDSSNRLRLHAQLFLFPSARVVIC